MKLFAALIICNLMTKLSNAQSDTLSLARKATTESILYLENRIESFPSADSFYELSATCGRIKYQVSKETNLGNLAKIRKYFDGAIRYFQNSEKLADKKAVAINIDRDLKLKLQPRDSSFHWHGTFNFGEEKLIKVTAKINGMVIKDGSIRMHWLYLRGAHLLEEIRNLQEEGHSSDYSNPYNMKITVPGVISFWLQDETSKKLYSPMKDYLELTNQDNAASMEFSELK